MTLTLETLKAIRAGEDQEETGIEAPTVEEMHAWLGQKIKDGYGSAIFEHDGEDLSFGFGVTVNENAQTDYDDEDGRSIGTFAVVFPKI